MIGYVKETKLFKDIFVDEGTGEMSYDVFKEWYKSCPFSDDNNDYPSEKTFYLIAYTYMDSHINSSIETFKNRFAVDLYTFYKEFEKTTEEIDKLMALTDDEIRDLGYSIVNFADIPETGYNTSDTEVEYITTQQKQINQKGNLQIRKEQLANKRTYTVRSFVAKFKHLFVRIVASQYEFVVGEPVE